MGHDFGKMYFLILEDIMWPEGTFPGGFQGLPGGTWSRDSVECSLF